MQTREQFIQAVEARYGKLTPIPMHMRLLADTPEKKLTLAKIYAALHCLRDSGGLRNVGVGVAGPDAN
jgi:hypothetical protein